MRNYRKIKSYLGTKGTGAASHHDDGQRDSCSGYALRRCSKAKTEPFFHYWRLVLWHVDRVVRFLPLRRAGRFLCRLTSSPATCGNGFLFSLGIFWTGFIVRPFGAVLFGHLGDLIGRKYTFMLTLGPDGAWRHSWSGVCRHTNRSAGSAPALLVACRVVQGLALGGEYGGAATYVAEHAPDGERGFYTSWIQTTATLGIVMALLVDHGVPHRARR